MLKNKIAGYFNPMVTEDMEHGEYKIMNVDDDGDSIIVTWDEGHYFEVKKADILSIIGEEK